MILRKTFEVICDVTRVPPHKIKKVNRTLEHIEHSGAVAVGVEFLFHPQWWILAGTVGVVWVLRLVFVEVMDK